MAFGSPLKTLQCIQYYLTAAVHYTRTLVLKTDLKEIAFIRFFQVYNIVNYMRRRDGRPAKKAHLSHMFLVLNFSIFVTLLTKTIYIDISAAYLTGRTLPSENVRVIPTYTVGCGPQFILHSQIHQLSFNTNIFV